ncbi:MAG: helix-turn-helix domain-containing protein [Magnetococcus sp. YQC-3]
MVFGSANNPPGGLSIGHPFVNAFIGRYYTLTSDTDIRLLLETGHSFRDIARLCHVSQARIATVNRTLHPKSASLVFSPEEKALLIDDLSWDTLHAGQAKRLIAHSALIKLWQL